MGRTRGRSSLVHLEEVDWDQFEFRNQSKSVEKLFTKGGGGKIPVRTWVGVIVKVRASQV